MKLDQRTLMAYFDGELPDDEAAEVEARLERDPEAQLLFSNLSRLGEVVRDHALSGTAAHVDLSDAIMAGIERADAEAVEPAPATRVERERDGRAPVVPLRSSRRGRTIGAFVGASLAVAAAAVLLVRGGHAPTTTADSQRALPTASQHELATRPLSEQGAQEEASVASAEGVAPASIEAVDFGGQGGSIFVISEGEEATPVVWLVDEPVPTPGRIESL